MLSSAAVAARSRGPRLAVVPVVPVVTAVLLVAGLALRGWLLLGRRGALDSDEAVIGLIARHIVAGERPTFFWGQSYGGPLESYLTAPVFAVTGSSVLVLKLVPAALSGVAALLVWRIGLRTIGERAAAAAGGLAWCFPGVFVWWSVKARGFYWSSLVLGLLVVLIVLRLERREARRGEWLVLGLATGLGWWGTPQIVFLVLPAGLWLLVCRRRALAGLPLGLLGFAIGALPWLQANLTSGFPSLQPLPGSPGGYTDHLHSFAYRGLSMLLGQRVPVTETWLWRPIGIAVCLAAVAGVLAAVRLFVASRDRGLGLLLLLAVAMPLLLAAIPNGGYVGEGRYLLPFLPVVALLGALALRGALCGCIVQAAAITGAAVAGALALSVAALARLPPTTGLPETSRWVPADTGPLRAVLGREGIDRVFADYWIAYRLDFETRERVVAASTGTERSPAYTAMVRASPSPAWVFVDGSNGARTFDLQLAAAGIRATRWRAGGFVVTRPARAVLPGQLPAAALPDPEPLIRLPPS